MDGWIKLHRKIINSFIYPNNRVFTKFEAWIDLLMIVNEYDEKVLIKNETFTCKRGQSIRSVETYQKRWGWTRQSVRCFMAQLEKGGMIIISATTKTTILTICNYDSYTQEQPEQPNNNQTTTNKQPTNNQQTTMSTDSNKGFYKAKQPNNNQTTTNKQPTNNQQTTITTISTDSNKDSYDQQTTTNNNIYNINNNNNINNKKNIYNRNFDFLKLLIGLGVDEKIANDWMEVRKLKKAANTETAFNGLKNQIEISGLSANECIKLAVESSWCGFKADWVKNKNYGTNSRYDQKTLFADDPQLFCGLK